MCKYWVFDKLQVVKANINKFVKELIDDRSSNPDGSGFYFFNKKTGSLIVNKYYPKTSDKVIEEAIFDCLNSFTKGSLFIYHNRWSTSGDKTKSQCHPIPIEHCDEYGFNIYQGWYVVHNGVLPDFEVTGIENLSDTQVLARSIGQWMYDHNIKSPLEFGEKRWKEYFETLFSGSKVTIVHEDEYYTINSELGVYEDGVWKSSATKTYGSNAAIWQYYEDEVVNIPTKKEVYTTDSGIDVEWDANGVPHYVESSVPDYDPKNKNK